MHAVVSDHGGALCIFEFFYLARPDTKLSGIEVHGAHRYLVAQFLSAASNRRTDAYGGAMAGERTRFLIKIMEAIRLFGERVLPHV